jgi:hypothetical protein
MVPLAAHFVVLTQQAAAAAVAGAAQTAAMTLHVYVQ